MVNFCEKCINLKLIFTQYKIICTYDELNDSFNLLKELIRQIIVDRGFQTPKNIVQYLKDIFHFFII